MSSEEKPDMVNAPPHYAGHKSGIECISFSRELGFALGNALKYCWRLGLKDDPIEELQKARWYLKDHYELSAGAPAFVFEELDRMEIFEFLRVEGDTFLGRIVSYLFGNDIESAIDEVDDEIKRREAEL